MGVYSLLQPSMLQQDEEDSPINVRHYARIDLLGLMTAKIVSNVVMALTIGF